MDGIQEDTPNSLEKIEVELLLSALYSYYGLDFREYSRASLYRRIVARMEIENLGSILLLLNKVLRDKKALNNLLNSFPVHTTEMFRDPEFFAYFREKICPFLKSYPHVRIWHAGCSSGEEVYSLAILLAEEGLLDRCQLYATDISERILDQAKEGIYTADQIKKFTSNYQKSKGKKSLSQYFTIKYGQGMIHDYLRKPILFAQHNLVTDASFCEPQVIICRNVMIYFNNKLKSRVTRLFEESLSRQGFLCLGTKEAINDDEIKNFEIRERKLNIFQLRMGL